MFETTSTTVLFQWPYITRMQESLHNVISGGRRPKLGGLLDTKEEFRGKHSEESSTIPHPHRTQDTKEKFTRRQAEQWTSREKEAAPERHHLLTLDRILVCDSDLGKLLATFMTFLSAIIPAFTSARRRCSLINGEHKPNDVVLNQQFAGTSYTITIMQQRNEISNNKKASNETFCLQTSAKVDSTLQASTRWSC